MAGTITGVAVRVTCLVDEKGNWTASGESKDFGANPFTGAINKYFLDVTLTVPKPTKAKPTVTPIP